MTQAKHRVWHKNNKVNGNWTAETDLCRVT